MPGHTDVAVLHGVHVRSHERRDIDPLGAIFAALATLLAELGLRGEGLIGEKFLLAVGVCQVADHSKVLLQVLISAEARDGGRAEIVVEHPFQERSLAFWRQFFREFGIWANRASGLSFHGYDSDAALGCFFNRG